MTCVDRYTVMYRSRVISAVAKPSPAERNPLTVLLKKYGIGIKFVPDDKPESFAAAIDDKTKAIYVETIGNPKYNVAPLPELAKVAHDHGIPLLVDNTFGAGGERRV